MKLVLVQVEELHVALWFITFGQKRVTFEVCSNRFFHDLVLHTYACMRKPRILLRFWRYLSTISIHVLFQILQTAFSAKLPSSKQVFLLRQFINLQHCRICLQGDMFYTNLGATNFVKNKQRKDTRREKAP